MSKGRISVIIIIAVILIAAIAAGIWFLKNRRDKTPSKGTYVIEYRGEVLQN